MVVRMKTNTSPVLPGEVQEYIHLQRQIHDALRKEHPEWVEPNGESPMCDSYEARLAEQLDTFTRRGSRARKGDFPSQ
jgi:hypothetical protein